MSDPSRKRSHRDVPRAEVPQQVDWLLSPVEWLVTCDEAFRVWAPGAVAVRGDTIVAVGSRDAVEGSFRGRRRKDLSGCIVCPGLVNTHVHGAMSVFRGIADDLPLQRWLKEVIFPIEAAHVNADLVYLGTLLSTVEMILGGTTTFCDGYFFEGTAAVAVRDSGIRAVLGQGILGFPTPDQPDPSKAMDRATAFLKSFPSGNHRLRPSLFCHAPYTCSPETLLWVKGICREHGCLFQTHLSETRSEVEDLTRKYGRRPVIFLDDLGILDAATLCAHAVWVDEEEIARLAERRVAVSHNPQSNMKLGAGAAPVPRMLEAGLTVGLGTDGCASNNDLDLFGEMAAAARLHKVVTGNPVACSAQQVLRMATRMGARALGWDSDIGSIEAGKKADLIAVDCRSPHLTPLYDPVSHLVYAARSSDVSLVWVGGDLVVEDGKIRTVDEEKLRREVAALARRISRSLTFR